MDLLAFLLLSILAIVSIIAALLPKNKGQRLIIVGIIFGVPFAIFFLDEILGQSYLRLNCVLDGGLVVNENINADGYVEVGEQWKDFGCGTKCYDALTRQGFEFYEIYVNGTPASPKSKSNDVHHFSLVDRATGKCSNELNQIAFENYKYNKFPPNTKCLSYKRLKTPMAGYEVYPMEDEHVFPFYFSKYNSNYMRGMYKQVSYIRDRKDGSAIASYTRYWWWGGWLRNNSFGSNNATRCPDKYTGRSAIMAIVLNNS